MKIYDILDEYNKLELLLEENEGEITEEIQVLLDSLTGEVKDKFDNLNKLRINIKADIQLLSAEKQIIEQELTRLESKINAKENKIVRLEEFIKFISKKFGDENITKSGNVTKQFKTNLFSASVSKTESIDDSEFITLTLDDIFEKEKVLITEGLLKAIVPPIELTGTEENKKLLSKFSIVDVKLDKREVLKLIKTEKIETSIKIIEKEKITIK